MNRVKRWSLAVISVLGASLATSVLADSGRVAHVRNHFEGSVVLTSLCPFPVTAWSTVDLLDTLFFDENGALVRVLETAEGLAQTEYSANGQTLQGFGSGGFEITYNPDGSVTVYTFGLEQLVTIAGYGVIRLVAGRAEYQLYPFPELLFSAGPSMYDRDAFCAALS